MTQNHRALRSFLVPIIGAMVLLSPRGSLRADDDVPVPAELQASLLAKVSSYDRNLAERSGDKVRIMLVGKPSEPTSMPFVRQMAQALSDVGGFGKLPHEEQVIEYKGADDLAQKCKTEHISILYLGPGFHGDVEAIRGAFDTTPVLTVTATPADVARGIILGFDLVYGKPKLVLHLAQARKQKIDLVAEVLKLMRIIE
jgi:hypothetical protein